MFRADTQILIVDDVFPMVNSIKGELRRLGFNRLVTASDGAEALEILNAKAKEGEPIELIISDWLMPRMNGLELLKAVRSQSVHKHLPFIMITTEGEASQVVEAAQAGVTNYLVKPFSANSIQEKLLTTFKKVTHLA